MIGIENAGNGGSLARVKVKDEGEGDAKTGHHGKLPSLYLPSTEGTHISSRTDQT
jgi:hypothetical protein